MTNKKQNKKANNLKFIAIAVAITIPCSLGFRYLLQEGHDLQIQSKKSVEEVELIPEKLVPSRSDEEVISNPEKSLEVAQLDVKKLNSDNVEEEHKKLIEDDAAKELGNFNATMSKTLFVVNDKLDTCKMQSMRFMFREQRILLPGDSFSPENIKELKIYYGKDENLLATAFGSVKEFRDYAKEHLSESTASILSLGYFKFGKREEKAAIKFFPKAGPNSNDHYLSVNATNMPGKAWPSVIVVEYKDGSTGDYNYLVTRVEDASKLEHPPEVMPFSFHFENGLLVTKGLANIKNKYSVNYEALYENRGPESYIQEVSGHGGSEEVVFEVPNANQLSRLDVMYDVNPGEYNINFDSQYKITLFDLEDPFFNECNPKIKGFERTELAEH